MCIRDSRDQGALDYTVCVVAEASALPGLQYIACLLYTSPSPRDRQKSRMPSSALKIRRPPRSTPLYSSAASDVYKRQPGSGCAGLHGMCSCRGQRLARFTIYSLSLIHISEPTRQAEISYAVFCFKDTATTEIYTSLFVGSVRCV